MLRVLSCPPLARQCNQIGEVFCRSALRIASVGVAEKGGSVCGSGSSKQPELLPALVDSATPDIEDIAWHEVAEKSSGKHSDSLSWFAASDESEMPAQAAYLLFRGRLLSNTRQRRARVARCLALNHFDAAIPTLKFVSCAGRRKRRYRGYYGKAFINTCS